SLLGHKVRAIKVRSTIQTTPPMVSDGWVDSDGMPLIMELNLGSFKVRVLRSDRQTAHRVDQLPELFLSTFVKADGPIDRGAGRVELRLSVPDALPDLPQTSMQHFERTNPRSGELTIQRSNWKHLRLADRDPPHEYLARSTYLDIDDPLIVELAEKARGDAGSGVELADRLRRFVTRYIHKKALHVRFAPAAQVAKSREGECP